jgi:hypothetical protein
MVRFAPSSGFPQIGGPFGGVEGSAGIRVVRGVRLLGHHLGALVPSDRAAELRGKIGDGFAASTLSAAQSPASSRRCRRWLLLSTRVPKATPAGPLPHQLLSEPRTRRDLNSSVARAGRYDPYEIQGLCMDGKLMSEHEDVDVPPSRLFPGVCHRCGWTRPVSKVGRVGRKRLRTGRSLRRLCDECIYDLLRQQSVGEGTPDPRKTILKVLRHRNVA